MAKNRIALQLKDSAETVIERTRAYASESGHFFEGDCHCGAFRGRSMLGKISGQYTIEGQTLYIDLKEKPPLVPVKKIQQALEAYFNH